MAAVSSGGGHVKKQAQHVDSPFRDKETVGEGDREREEVGGGGGGVVTIKRLLLVLYQREICQRDFGALLYLPHQSPAEGGVSQSG